MEKISWTEHMGVMMATAEIDGKYYTIGATKETDQEIIDRIKAMPIEEPLDDTPTVARAIDIIVNADLSKEDITKLETINTKIDTVITDSKVIIEEKQ